MKNEKRHVSLLKSIFFSGTIIFTLFLFLEIVARFIVPPHDVLIHREHEKIITILGLPALNETMEFDPYLFWRLKKNLRNFRIKGKIRQHEMAFTISTNNYLRTPALSPNKDRVRILAIGDSTTFGLGVNDKKTWPSQLQKMLIQKGYNTEVINAGVPGYSAFQGKRFLEKIGLQMQPDLVILNFGFNDFDFWSSRSDMETARLLTLKKWESLLVRSRFYYGLKKWLSPTYARGLDRTNGQNIEKNAHSIENKSTKKVQKHRLSPGEFLNTLKKIKKLCDERNIPAIFIIWPFAGQVQHQDSTLINYQKITADICHREKAYCTNLVDPFIKGKKRLFIDHIHANADGCHLTAKTLLPKIISILRIK